MEQDNGDVFVCVLAENSLDRTIYGLVQCIGGVIIRIERYFGFMHTHLTHLCLHLHWLQPPTHCVHCHASSQLSLDASQVKSSNV